MYTKLCTTGSRLKARLSKSIFKAQYKIFYDCQKRRGLNFLINGLEIGCKSTMYTMRKLNQWF